MNTIELIEEELQIRLSHVLNRNISSISYQSIHGGSINAVFRLSIDQDLYLCCKINDAAKYPAMFQAEAAGLSLLRSPGIIRVPQVLLVTEIQGWQLLIMEWIETHTPGKPFWEKFGEQLSALHNQKAERFGLGADNYMGALPQSNNHHNNWTSFFYAERIQPQVKLAVHNKLMTFAQARSFDKLLPALPGLFPDAEPCLLHGDLWNGNFLCDTNQRPVLIDPAVYYGHAAVDLGLTTLFGGFDEAFYQSYNHHSPFPANYREQWDACNLYPLLIHLNLFGHGYLPGIMEIAERY